MNVPVSTWRFHKCESNHRTHAVFMKCALKKYEQNPDGNWTLPKTETYGAGQWAVVERHYSGDYYSEHNGRRRNHGYVLNNVHLFRTAEEAEKAHIDLQNRLMYGSSSPRYLGPLPQIIKVEL